MSEPLRDVDMTPCEWNCIHCEARVDFAADPTPIFKHLALECSLMEETKLAEHAESYRLLRTFSPVRRALVAHLIKHPEDSDASFRPPAGFTVN